MKKEFFKPEVEVIEIGMDVLTDTELTSSTPVMAFASPNIIIDSQSGHDTTILADDYSEVAEDSG